MILSSATAPLYERVYLTLRDRILGGQLLTGERLPSSRALADDLGVSRNVVLIAYDKLLSEGYTETKAGSGTFVRALTLPTQIQTATDLKLSDYGNRAVEVRPRSPYAEQTALPYNFRYGLTPPDEQLARLWKRSLAKQALSVPLDYQNPAGYLPLRRALASYLGRARGVVASAEQILITGGSQQALDLSARVLLNPGDTVLLEDPHYQGARLVFQARGAKLHYAKVDHEGLRVPDAVEEKVAAKLAYVTPSHQFPSGAVLSLKRRLELLEWAHKNEAFILEDDYDSEFRYHGKPIPAIQGLTQAKGRVIYMGTFSKLLFPSLRLGFVVLPPNLVEVFAAAKWLSDRFSPVLEQAALAELMSSGRFERHVRRMRVQHAKRRRALLKGLKPLKNTEIQGSNAGLHLVVWLNDFSPKDAERLVSKAHELGVGIYPITPYYQQTPERLGLLMGYAALDESAIQEGTRRLASLV